MEIPIWKKDDKPLHEKMKEIQFLARRMKLYLPEIAYEVDTVYYIYKVFTVAKIVKDDPLYLIFTPLVGEIEELRLVKPRAKILESLYVDTDIRNNGIDPDKWRTRIKVARFLS